MCVCSNRNGDGARSCDVACTGAGIVVYYLLIREDGRGGCVCAGCRCIDWCSGKSSVADTVCTSRYSAEKNTIIDMNATGLEGKETYGRICCDGPFPWSSAERFGKANDLLTAAAGAGSEADEGAVSLVCAVVPEFSAMARTMDLYRVRVFVSTSVNSETTAAYSEQNHVVVASSMVSQGNDRSGECRVRPRLANAARRACCVTKP